MELLRLQADPGQGDIHRLRGAQQAGFAVARQGEAAISAAFMALVEAAAANHVGKFIGIGSQGEYGLLSGKITETALPVPTSLYGAAKVAMQVLASQLCADAGVEFAWLRLFSTYGPQDNPDWLIPSLITQMLDGQSSIMWVSYEGGGGEEVVVVSGRRDVGVPGGR